MPTYSNAKGSPGPLRAKPSQIGLLSYGIFLRRNGFGAEALGGKATLQARFGTTELMGG